MFWLGDYTLGILKMFNIVSGGALERMSIFALNLGPYISSSIYCSSDDGSIPLLYYAKKKRERGGKA